MLTVDGRMTDIVSPGRAHVAARGRFQNPWPGGAPHGFRDFLRWLLLERRDRRRREPPPALPRDAPTFFTPEAPPDVMTLTWVGHSSFLLQTAGRNVLLDPVWSERASPVSFAGPRRMAAPGIGFDALPPIHLVVVSHDHYDHLDRPTVERIVHDHPDAEWVAPLGVGRWLERRGADVTAELDWWQRVEAGPVSLMCTPAQHFSGRRLGRRNDTLWCGWVLRTSTHAVFVAGDTGLHPEFEAIARRLGPFDAALMPIGAYDPRWFMEPVHMDPAQAVAAYRALVAGGAGAECTFIAMHWGTFRLTDEPVDEPPQLTRAAWTEAGLPADRLWIPRHGETHTF